MVQSKREFFRNGVDNQKRPDIVIDLKRMEAKKIDTWTPEQRDYAKKFIRETRRVFDAFAEAIENL